MPAAREGRWPCSPAPLRTSYRPRPVAWAPLELHSKATSGGPAMNVRRLKGLGLVAASALVLAGGAPTAALGAPDSPAATVSWILGPTSPFAGTRFDGEYLASVNRIYYLGFRTTGDVTD